MIAFPRILARDVRAMCRRVFGSSACRELWLRLVTTDRELRIQAVAPDTALEYRVAENFKPGELLVPFDFMEACQASDNDLVSFTTAGNGVRALWCDRGVPWQRNAGKPSKKLSAFPGPVSETVANEPGFRQALCDVAACTDTENSRYALGCVQLDGERGQIAATDGRQLIVQTGYRFPWTESLLVRPNKGLWARELPPDAPVLVGRSKPWVSFSIGSWSIWQREQEGRFPQFADLVRDPARATSTLTIDPNDVAFALEAIEHLPAKAEPNRPVAFDLNGEVLVRAQPTDGSPAAELLLARSHCTGEPVKLVANRTFVSRALSMGLTNVAFYGNESLALAYDATRRYLFMPLDGETSVRQGQELVRISSLDAGHHQLRKRHTASSPAAVTIATTSTPTTPKEPVLNNSHSKNLPATAAKSESVIEQAVALRASLHDALTRTNELVRTLKHQQRHSKLVESTLQSLKQLQVAG